MQTTSKRMIWVGFALIAGYLIHGTLAEGSANDQVVQEQWQIATLTITSDVFSQVTVEWQSPDGPFLGMLPQASLAITGKRDEHTQQTLLDAIGEMGWQPVSYHPIGNIVRFCLKRRVQTPAATP